MIEELLAETRARHSTSPISQEDYDTWRNSDVTNRLFEELEIDMLEDAIDLTPAYESTDLAAMDFVAIKADQERVAFVLEWAPDGCKGANDED